MHANTGLKDQNNGNKQQRRPQTQPSELAQQQQQQNPQQPKQQQKVRKKKPMTPEHQLLVNVQEAAKTQNPAAGVAAYRAAIAANTNIHPDLYSTLLYLCSGGDAWELPLRQQLTESTALVEDIRQRAAADVAAQQEEEEAVTAAADQQAVLGSPDASAATAAGASNSSAQATSPLSQMAAAKGSGHATAVGSPTVAGSKSPPTVSEMVTANGATPTAVAGSVSHPATAVAAVEAASLPQLTPSQLREEGRAIFDHMQVKQCLAHLMSKFCL